MKNIIITICLLIFYTSSFGQQFPNYNHVYLNKGLYNPSTIGLTDQVDLMLIQRNTLVGFEQNPKTLYLTASGPIISDKMGAGISLYNETLGATKKTGAYGSYAYRAKLTKSQSLNFGISLGVLQLSLDPDLLTTQSDIDPLLANKNFSASTLDGSFGMSYVASNFELGLGMTQILGNKALLADEVNFNLERNYTATVQYTMTLDKNSYYKVTPLVVARYSESGLPQEAHLVFNYKDKLFLVPSYRSSGSFAGTVSANVYNSFKIGYSYETMIAQPLQGNQRGGHEVMLGYSFDIRSKGYNKQQKQIDDLSTRVDDFEKNQAIKDSIQDATDRKLQEGIDQNDKQIEENKAKLKDAESEIEKTQQDLEKLKLELIEQGVIRESDALDYEGSPMKGYYIVIASVKNVRYNEKAMEAEFLSKGYQKIYNTTRGWHYVYTQRVDDFSAALKLLKDARLDINNEAWIHILK